MLNNQNINDRRESYSQPEINKLGNVKQITAECPDWQCSVTVPPAP